MSEQEAINAFGKHLAAAVRSLPLPEACSVLRGAILIGESHPAAEPLRAIYNSLTAVDSQLELIAIGQLRLSVDGNQQGGDGQK